MQSLDINPEEVISNLSGQLGSLASENTVLKMAIQKLQIRIAELESQLGITSTPTPVAVPDEEEEAEDSEE